MGSREWERSHLCGLEGCQNTSLDTGRLAEQRTDDVICNVIRSLVDILPDDEPPSGGGVSESILERELPRPTF